MRLAGRVLLGLGIVLAVLAASGAGYQWLASRADAQRFPMPGELVRVDGLDLHLICRGHGRPVVILEAGLTTGSWSWGGVDEALAGETEVCAYDRPGMGWSTPTSRPATATEVADRLHRLIRARNIGGPYVLLGMSAGGVYVREYYHRYPADVVGMVLVDSSHEQQGSRLPPLGDQAQAERMLALCGWLQPIGVVRLIGAMEMMLDQPGIPEPARPLLRAKLNQSYYCASMLAEMQGFAADVRDPDPPASLGDLPLLVLSQGKAPEGVEAFGISDEQARAQRVVWDELQLELTALSSRGKRLVAHRSGHPIQLEQPELVIQAVSGMLAELRSRGDSDDPGEVASPLTPGVPSD